MTYISSTTT